MKAQLPDQLNKPTFLSAPTAAMLCGVTRNTVCTWIRNGKLASYHTVGGKNLIRPADLVEFMNAHQMFIPADLVEMAEREENGAGTDEAVASGTERPEAGILIVDDLADARKLAATCLKKLGLPIHEAESGYEALHVLLKHPEISLVVLDIMMPGQLGTDTLVEIRKHNEHMPVIVVTGYVHSETAKLFETTKPDVILSKPYKPAELVQEAQTLLAAA